MKNHMRVVDVKMPTQTSVEAASNLDQSPAANNFFETGDGHRVEAPDKSLNHLWSKHGHDFEIDDLLENQATKDSPYQQPWTRINNANRALFESKLTEFSEKIKSTLGLILGRPGRIWLDSASLRVIAARTMEDGTLRLDHAQSITIKQLQSFQRTGNINF